MSFGKPNTESMWWIYLRDLGDMEDVSKPPIYLHLHR
jgi:hypothetical protein